MEELFNKGLLDFLKKTLKEKDINISEALCKGLHCTKILEKNELNPIKKIVKVGYVRKKKL